MRTDVHSAPGSGHQRHAPHDDAKLYVAWLSRLTSKACRLLTEAKWEYAARAGSNTRYAWGDEPGIGNSNCNGCGGAWALQAAPVGSFRPNAFGIYDMEGNVWEWVEDIWHDDYKGAPVDGRVRCTQQLTCCAASTWLSTSAVRTAAPQKHCDRPLATCVGSCRPAAHMACFQAWNARSRRYCSKSTSVAPGQKITPRSLEGDACLVEALGHAVNVL